jgi:branched-chain amino acid transport system permease protein
VLPFVIAGLVLGSIYAIAATGLVITFQSTGVLNFSFGAMAYTVARLYYFLHTQHAWSILPAAIAAIFGLGPSLGLVLYAGLFRLLRQSTTLIKILATIGVSVVLPSVDILVFGDQPILSPPGLAPQPEKVFHVVGVGVTLDQIIVYSCVVVLGIGGLLVLQYTDIGLRVRAMVDSPALTSLSGTNPGHMSLGVWVVSSTIAGLVGVLVAPIIGLNSSSEMTLVMIAAFAAVIAAKARRVVIAGLAGLAIGVGESLIQYALPPASTVTADVLPSVPFLVAAIFLVYYTIRGEVDERETLGGALDRAIRPASVREAAHAVGAGGRSLSWRPSVVAFVLLCGLPLLLHSFWIGLMAEAAAYAIIFLSYSLVTGEGGMIWLCQATFAAIGGLSAGVFVSHDHVPILLAVLVGGLIAGPCGLLVGLLTVRMGGLYVALVTLTFGLLAQTLVFMRTVFYQQGTGIQLNSPSFAQSPLVLTYFCIGVFAVIALFIGNLRRSTTGLALGAVRSSVEGSKTLGISVVQMKVVLAGIAAFVAGIGGGLLAVSMHVALPSNYDTVGAEVWLAVLVTQGIRSNAAAFFAGMGFTLLAGLATAYLPQTFGNFVPIIFGLGAIAMVKYPEGILTAQARQIRSALESLKLRRPVLYGQSKVIGTVYTVAFIVLVATVQNLWWLWVVITIVVVHAVCVYLFRAPRDPFGAESEVVERQVRPVEAAMTVARNRF